MRRRRLDFARHIFEPQAFELQCEFGYELVESPSFKYNISQLNVEVPRELLSSSVVTLDGRSLDAQRMQRALLNAYENSAPGALRPEAFIDTRQSEAHVVDDTKSLVHYVVKFANDKLLPMTREIKDITVRLVYIGPPNERLAVHRELFRACFDVSAMTLCRLTSDTHQVYRHFFNAEDQPPPERVEELRAWTARTQFMRVAFSDHNEWFTMYIRKPRVAPDTAEAVKTLDSYILGFVFTAPLHDVCERAEPGLPVFK